MTNTIEEAFRLEVLERGDAEQRTAARWHDLGLVTAKTNARTGYRGMIEVAGRITLQPSTADLFVGIQKAGSFVSKVSRYRITRPDGATIEGPYSLETYFNGGEAGFELLIDCVGELEESGEKDPAVEAQRNDARVVAMVEAAASSFSDVASKLVATRPPELALDETVSAVVTGGLVGVIGTMRAADPTATAEELENELTAAVRAIVGKLAE